MFITALFLAILTKLACACVRVLVRKRVARKKKKRADYLLLSVSLVSDVVPGEQSDDDYCSSEPYIKSHRLIPDDHTLEMFQRLQLKYGGG